MSKTLKIASFAWACSLALLISASSPCLSAQQAPQNSPSSQIDKSGAAASPSNPHPIKLMLKDGSFELVREYQIKGDRVRYYDLDSSQWEEMPAALVDWDATKKVAADDAQREFAILAKVHKQEQERRADPLDIDASLEAAPGVFLPSGIGLWSFDGHGMQALSEAEIDSKLSKRQAIEKVVVPVPIVPTRHDISIKGQHGPSSTCALPTAARRNSGSFTRRFTTALVSWNTSTSYLTNSGNPKTACRCNDGKLPRVFSGLLSASRSFRVNTFWRKYCKTRK
jgi:hypothetical protein